MSEVLDSEINAYLRSHHLRRTSHNIAKARATLRKRKDRRRDPNAKEISVREAASEWQVIYGISRVGGIYTFINSTHSNQFLHLVITVAGHEITAIQHYFFNNQEVTFPSVPGFATGRYLNKAYVQVNFGSAGQSALSQLVADCPDKWTTAHKQSGRAHVYMKLIWDANLYPNGIPDITFEIEGKKVYDPRTGLFAFSSNPALCIADYLMDGSYGLGVPLAMIDTTSLTEAANICEELVTRLDGTTEVRYHLHGNFTITDNPGDTLEQMCSAMGGTISFIGGLWKFFPAKYRSPTLTLDENNFLSDISINTKISRRDNFNGVRGTYVEPQKNWEETDFPVVKNDFYMAQDNNERVWEDISLPFTIVGATCQRLAKIELERIRQGIIIQADFSLSSYQLQPGDTVQINNTRLGWTNKVFEVVECGLVFEDDEGGAQRVFVRMTLRETASGIYDWNNGEETQVDLAPDSDLPDPFSVTTPTGLTLQSGTLQLYIRSDGTVFSRIKVSWTAMPDFFVSSGGQIEIQYKQSASSDWSSATPVTGDVTFTHILDVQDGVLYDVRIRAVSALGIQSSYTEVDGHLVVGKTAPPSDVTGLSAEVGDFGVRLFWDDIPDLDRAAYLIKVGMTGDTWATSTLLDEVRTTNYLDDIQAAMTYKFQVKALDTSNNESLNEAIILVTIGAPSQPVVTQLISGLNVVLTWTDSVSLFAVDQYEIFYGDTFAGSIPLSTVRGTGFSTRIDWGGLRRFWVRGRDVAGNAGTPGSVDVLIDIPGPVTSLTSDVVDNNVLLRWDPPTSGTLPIDHYDVFKGDDFSTAELVGQVGGTFSALFELVAGTYVYWVEAIDSANNEGIPLPISAIVNQPPDFTLISDNDIDVSTGTRINFAVDNATLVGPVNTTQTYQDHFISNSWTTPQDQITAGYPYFIQPAATLALYQKTIDLGAVIPQALIKFQYVQEDIVGSIVVTPTVSYRLLSTDPWTEVTGVTEVFAHNFQFIRGRIIFGTIPLTGTPIGLLLSLTYSS